MSSISARVGMSIPRQDSTKSSSVLSGLVRLYQTAALASGEAAVASTSMATRRSSSRRYARSMTWAPQCCTGWPARLGPMLMELSGRRHRRSTSTVGVHGPVPGCSAVSGGCRNVVRPQRFGVNGKLPQGYRRRSLVGVEGTGQRLAEIGAVREDHVVDAPVADIHAFDRQLLEDQGVDVVALGGGGEAVFDLDLGVGLAEGDEADVAGVGVVGCRLPRDAVAERRLLVGVLAGVGVVRLFGGGEGLGEVGGQDTRNHRLVVADAGEAKDLADLVGLEDDHLALWLVVAGPGGQSERTAQKCGKNGQTHGGPPCRTLLRGLCRAAA